ncbi:MULTISPECIES: outer membrane beta-barrel protein [Winogradskyella]|uniref:Outer membrane beta-barrel protein n=1 Tax=Winogradskyella marincola TaxID=3037795 RepID=A0ABT6G4X0_9FLAO|nr:outer membrane beta-barrel protein [Winogradskyella sp. YYF002]MDG4717080.1 outer membrane beta-barrel protein [Winogradskyella sp. YYF002]
MKKVLLTAAIAVFGLTNMNAQEDEKTFGFSEGDFFVEGNVSFNSENDKNIDEKSNEFNISPKVGYFINDDLAIGAELLFASSKTELDGTDTSDFSGFGVGAFGRYYFLDLGERFKTNAEFGVGYASMEDKLAEVKENSFGAGLGLGINYFVTEKIALTFGLKNILSFSSTKLDVDGAEAETSFNLGFGDVANPFGGNASFGLLFVF